MFENIIKDLINVEKPGRYIGNEAGIPDKDFINSYIKTAICYPDIYEIGMSNYGIKILYDIVNKIDFASCERVFSPWFDFEKYLRDKNEVLFSLESKTPINNFDILGISIQYELLFSNFLNILDLSHISLRTVDRKENDPIVIIGGPGAVNPIPYSPFTDLVVIGEGEEVLSEIVYKLKELKDKKVPRIDKVRALSGISGVYSKEFSKERVKRRVFMGFDSYTGPDNMIIPSIDVIQNKLVVEIMRGCPNKCRFCQAGVIYKPYREKNTSIIMNSIKKGLRLTGVNEVTLSSLSSGDYSQLLKLMDYFNDKYSQNGVSLSLPSLKVETFDTDLLDRLSTVRKSGLTFAVESGSSSGQLSLNKRVDIEKIFNILDIAVVKGWKIVKLYFMIGLPDERDDTEDIKKFVDSILMRYKRLLINVNISTFVPKPHTPYETVNQISLDTAKEKINSLKDYYKRTRVSIKSHEPEMSYIEGFISRGDEKIGYCIEKAFYKGARFDGWNDKFDFNLYKSVFTEENISEEYYLRPVRKNNPWNIIDPLVAKDFLDREREMSKNSEESILCKEGCDPECGLCDDKIKTVDAVDDFGDVEEIVSNVEKGRYRYYLEFTKKGLSKYLSHKDIMRYFEILFRMTETKIMMSEGFNPHPRFQFSSALSLGIESQCEILEFYTTFNYSESELFDKLSAIKNIDIVIKRLRKCISDKKVSIYENLYSTVYLLKFKKSDYIAIMDDFKHFKSMEKLEIIDGDNSWDLKNIVTVNSENSDEGIEILVRKVNPGPRIVRIVNAILINKEIDIIKSGMKMFNNNELDDLYNLD